MERYSDKWIIIKETKSCHDSSELFDDVRWTRPDPIAVVDSYDDARDFISNRYNLEYYLRMLNDVKEWNIHPDTNENHRVFYIREDREPFENEILFVRFSYMVAPHYK